MTTATIIFGALNVSGSIAGYMGLIESVESNVQKLLHQSFKSAIQNLEYAKTASANNRLDYLKSAKDKFIDAISVEENENLISAIVGLAMCQHLLGDRENVRKTLSRINDVELSTAEKTKTISKTAFDVLKLKYLSYPFNAAREPNPFISDYSDRVARFEEYKRKALSTK